MMAELSAFARENPWPTVFIVGIVCYYIYRTVDAIVSRGRIHPDDVDDED